MFTPNVDPAHPTSTVGRCCSFYSRRCVFQTVTHIHTAIIFPPPTKKLKPTSDRGNKQHLNTFCRTRGLTMQISLLHLNISVFPDTYDEDHLARKPDKPSNSIAFSPQTRVYFLFIRFIPADSHSATLKTSLEICFTVGWKRHVSPPFPFSVSLSLSLLSSHSPCLIRSVISPHSGWCLLIWQRYCLPVRCCCLHCLLSHLTNSSKGRRKGMGENSCKSCRFAQLTVQVWLRESLSSDGARNVCLLV